MQVDEKLWRQLRPFLLERGDGEEHGDDHHDENCDVCQAIKTIDGVLGK